MSKGPVSYEKIMISQKRGVAIKLWPPRHSETYGWSRASIEIQAVSYQDDGTPKYGESLRLPTSEKTLLFAELVKEAMLLGRNLNTEFKQSQKNTETNQTIVEEKPDSIKAPADPKLPAIILEQFQGEQTILSKIMSQLAEMGVESSRDDVLNALDSLLERGVVQKEEKTAQAGHTYTVWNFLDRSQPAQ